MKSILRTLAITLLCLSSAFAADAPRLDAVRAAKIAGDYLASLREPSGPYITSVTLDIGGIIAGERSWIVRWSAPFGDSKQPDVGVRVRMDGSYVRLVGGGKAERGNREPSALGIR